MTVRPRSPSGIARPPAPDSMARHDPAASPGFPQWTDAAVPKRQRPEAAAANMPRRQHRPPGARCPVPHGTSTLCQHGVGRSRRIGPDETVAARSDCCASLQSTRIRAQHSPCFAACSDHRLQARRFWPELVSSAATASSGVSAVKGPIVIAAVCTRAFTSA